MLWNDFDDITRLPFPTKTDFKKLRQCCHVTWSVAVHFRCGEIIPFYCLNSSMVQQTCVLRCQDGSCPMHSSHIYAVREAPKQLRLNTSRCRTILMPAPFWDFDLHVFGGDSCSVRVTVIFFFCGTIGDRLGRHTRASGQATLSQICGSPPKICRKTKLVNIFFVFIIIPSA